MLLIALSFAVDFNQRISDNKKNKMMNRTAKDSSIKLLTALSFAVDFNQRISEYKKAPPDLTDGAL